MANIKRKIIMITHKELPFFKPSADDVRFMRLSECFFKLGYEIIMVGMTHDYNKDKPSTNLKYEKNNILIKIPKLKLLKRALFNRRLSKYLLDNYSKEENLTIFINNPKIIEPIYKLKNKNKKIRIICDVMGIISKEVLVDEKNKFISKMASIIYSKLEEKTYTIADLILTINNSHREYIKKEYGRNSYIVRDASIPIKYSKLRKKTKDRKTKIVLFVGRLYRNRLKTFMDVANIIKLEEIPVKFQIVGDGPDYKKYVDLINKKKLSNVELLGYKNLEEIMKLINNADVCYSDVYLEGFPFKVFEYMSIGKPIIVENNNSVREVIENNRNGLIYNNSKDLYRKIKILLSDKNLREKLSKNSREDFIKHHTWDVRVKQLKRILNENAL
jgi:glycosyltransferase involved in cell wall biosynthesis